MSTMDPRIDPSRYLRNSAIEDFRTHQRHHRRSLIFGALMAAFCGYSTILSAQRDPWWAGGVKTLMVLTIAVVVVRDVITGRRESRMLLRRAVIAVLRADGPAYGLELREKIGIGASIYPYLWEIEAEGLVTSEEREGLPCRGGRPRRYYRLAEKGGS